MSPRIDVHHHHASPALAEEYERAGVRQVGGAPLPSWSAEDSLAALDRHGIDTAILSAPYPLHFAKAEASRRVALALNEAAAEAVRAQPRRFGFAAALPLPFVEPALEELAYALDELGADAIGLLSNHGGVYLGDERLDPVLAELDAREATVLVHPTVSTGERLPREANAGSPVRALEPSLFEFVFDTTRAIANLVVSGALTRFAKVRWVFAHAGGTVPFLHDRVLDRRPILAALARAQAGEAPPPSGEELERLMREAQAEALSLLRGLHYDTALSTDPTVLGDLQELAGAERILLGTDYPIAREIGLDLNLRGVAGYDGFDAAEREAVEGGNALRLFPRLAPVAIAGG